MAEPRRHLIPSLDEGYWLGPGASPRGALQIPVLVPRLTSGRRKTDPVPPTLIIQVRESPCPLTSLVDRLEGGGVKCINSIDGESAGSPKPLGYSVYGDRWFSCSGTP